MRFTFEECELVNSFFDGLEGNIPREIFINRLENARDNTDNPELIQIANKIINKIKSLDNETFNKLYFDYPIDEYTDY